MFYSGCFLRFQVRFVVVLGIHIECIQKKMASLVYYAFLTEQFCSENTCVSILSES